MTTQSVAGDDPKCRRSEKKFGPATLFCPCDRFALQMTPKTQTCDALPPDQRHSTTPPATVTPPSGSGAMAHTFWADYAHFIAHLVNESHVFGVFCAVRCPTSGEEALVSKPVAARGEREGRSERSERRVWAPMLPAARVANGVAARGSELGETRRRRRSGRGRSGAP